MAQPRCLVTGGGRGIGRAVALRFAREGAKVVVAARSSDQLDAVVAEIAAAGGEGLAAQMNVGDHGSVEAAIYRALEFTGGGLDVLVNAAAVFEPAPFDRTDVASWNRHVEVNLSGPFLVTLEALDALEEGERAHVFILCCPQGSAPRKGQAAYAATQQGLLGLSDALRLDLGERGIRVSAVLPPEGAAEHTEAVAEGIWRAYTAGDGGRVEVAG